MKEQFRPQPENPRQHAPEAGSGSIGVSPPTPEHSPQGKGSKSPEREPRPDVWEFLERRERYHDWSRGLEAGTRDPEEYPNEIKELSRLLILRKKIIHEGTAHENLTLKLYETKIELWGATPGSSLSSLEEFQQFRSKVKPLSDEQITEEIRKQEKENRRKLLAGMSLQEKRQERSRRYYKNNKDEILKRNKDYRQRRKNESRSQTEQQRPIRLSPPPLPVKE